MLATAVLDSVAPISPDQHPAIAQPEATAPAIALPKGLSCFWAVDPATGALCAQWGVRARR